MRYLAPVVLGAALSSSACSRPTYDVEVKHEVTDSRGLALFTDKHTGELVELYVIDQNQSPVEGANVTFFDGNLMEAFLARHEDFQNPDFQIFPHNSSHTLTLASNTYTGHLYGKQNRPEQFDAAVHFSSWARADATQSAGNFGYQGCSTQSDFEDRLNAQTILWDLSKTNPVTASVSSPLETLTKGANALSQLMGDVGIFADPKNCVAINYFGWLGPGDSDLPRGTGALLLSYCLDKLEPEICGDTLDNDCNGFLDWDDPACPYDGKPNSQDTLDTQIQDSGNQDTDNPLPSQDCSPSDVFCDSFEGSSLSSSWDTYCTNTVENGTVNLGGNPCPISTAQRLPSSYRLDLVVKTDNPPSLFRIGENDSGSELVISTSTRQRPSISCESGDDLYIEGFDLAPGENTYRIQRGTQGTQVYHNGSLVMDEPNCRDLFPNQRQIVSLSGQEGTLVDLLRIR